MGTNIHPKTVWCAILLAAGQISSWIRNPEASSTECLEGNVAHAAKAPKTSLRCSQATCGRITVGAPSFCGRERCDGAKGVIYYPELYLHVPGS